MSDEIPIVIVSKAIRLILAGSKTMDRRIVDSKGNGMHYGRLLGEWGLSEPPELKDGVLHWVLQTDVDDNEMYEIKCPYGQAGDILWVKETWRIDSVDDIHHKMLIDYYADNHSEIVEFSPKIYNKLRKFYQKNNHYDLWQPCLDMPREVARLFLEVKDIRVERLQDMTEVDAIDSGALRIPNSPEYQIAFDEAVNTGTQVPVGQTPRQRFMRDWDTAYAKRGYGSEINPWLFVVRFERRVAI